MKHRLLALVILPLSLVCSRFLDLEALGSNSSCGNSGGCSCQPVSCPATHSNQFCSTYTSCMAEGGSCTSDHSSAEYRTIEQQNATRCVSNGPLVGAGCVASGSSYCFTLRRCRCDPFLECEVASEEEAGLYVPCQPLD